MRFISLKNNVVDSHQGYFGKAIQFDEYKRQDKMQLLIILLTIVSLTLALISITTNYWYQSLSNEFNEGLWIICRRRSSIEHPLINTHLCEKQPFFKSQVLAILSFILLTFGLICSIIRRYRKGDRRLAFLTIALYTISTILLMFTYLSYPRKINFRQLGYSIYFIITSSLLTLILTGLIAFTIKSNN